MRTGDIKNSMKIAGRPSRILAGFLQDPMHDRSAFRAGSHFYEEFAENDPWIELGTDQFDVGL